MATWRAEVQENKNHKYFRQSETRAATLNFKSVRKLTRLLQNICRNVFGKPGNFTYHSSISTQSCRSLHSLHWSECKDQQLWVEIDNSSGEQIKHVTANLRLDGNLEFRIAPQSNSPLREHR